MKVYLVGGAVRDELLGLPVSERDWVVVGATVEEMLTLDYIPVGKFFPVFLHPETKEEYALARLERKVAAGYHGFTFDTSAFVTLEQDLMRRDLTINAMAKTAEGEIIDPYGGQIDLKQKLLRHVSPAFVEDPVRVLRVARFAARYAHLGFKVAPETLILMQEMGDKGELDFLVPERVAKEMLRALAEPLPVAFIQVLRLCNALRKILPEVNALYGVPQNIESHPEKDTGIHTEMVLHQASCLSHDPLVRFAALVHDVGKGLTPEALWPRHPDHELLGEPLVQSLCERLRLSSDFQALGRLVTRYHLVCHKALEKSAAEILGLFEQCDAFRKPERFAKFILACEADFRGRPGYETKEYRQGIMLNLAFAIAQRLNTAEVVAACQEKGLQGEAIKIAIHEARLAAMSAQLEAIDHKR